MAALLPAALPVAAPSQEAPLPLPLHDPAYVQLEGLENSGCVAGRVSPFRPYTVDRIRQAIRVASGDPSCSPALVAALRERFGVQPGMVAELGSGGTNGGATAGDTVVDRHLGAAVTARGTSLGRGELRPLWRDIRPADQGDPPLVGTVRARGWIAPARRLVLVAEGYAQTHRRNDPIVRPREVRSTTGVVGVSEATINGAFGPAMLSFGRDREAWLGRGVNSLAIAAHGPPLDRLVASLAFRRFEARALYAVIGDVVLDTLSDGLPSGTPDQRFHRTVIAHALTWRPSRRFEATIGETILLSRGSRTLEFGYANPLMPFILTQQDADREDGGARDNLFLFGAITARVGRTQLTGEVLVDDYQLDEESAVTPNQLGWRIEARQGFGGALPLSLGIEYERADGYTYLKGLYTDVYQFNDQPLGSELGPDADRVRATGEAWLNEWFRLTATLGVWRRGAQRIDRRPARGAVDAGPDGFLTKTPEDPFVQRSLIGGIDAELLTPVFPLVLSLEGARVENPDHAAVGTATYVRAQLKATYAFRYP